MPETARTGKRVYGNLWSEAERSSRVGTAHTCNSRRHRHRRMCRGVTRDASHDDLRNGHKPNYHKGAGERWRKSLNGYPLTTGCGGRNPVPRSTQLSLGFESFKPQSRRRPLSSTPTPPRRPHRARTASQSCALQICIRHHRVDAKSSTGSESTLRGEVTSSSWRRPFASQAPSSSRRSSPSLLSSPYCPPSQSLVVCRFSTCANRRHCISLTTSRKKKKSFTPGKRLCGILAHALAAAYSLSRRHRLATVADGERHQQSESAELQKCPSNGRFHGASI
jgi:hypothetical protein